MPDKRTSLPFLLEEGDPGEGTETGAGGQSGSIAFRDFMGTGGEISAAEAQHLQRMHPEVHKEAVSKQKAVREERAQRKEQESTQQLNAKQGLGGGGGGQQAAFKDHPELSKQAQFSGIDRQVSSLPNENIADTNPKQRDELQNQYRLRHQPTPTPQFHPKPQPH